MDRLKKIWYKIRGIWAERRRVREFRRENAKYPTELNSNLKKKFYKKGFFANNIINYELTENDYEEYVSDWDRLFNIREMNQHHKFVLKDKMIFHNYFRNKPCIVPPLAFINRGSLIDFSTQQILSPEKLIERSENDLILKPCRGGEGDDVFKLKVKYQKKSAALGILKKTLQKKESYVLQECIKQNGIYREINPYAVNTIRILTMQDPNTGEPFIARAVQRFGSEESGYVDNWSAGGLSVDIDLKEGTYKKGAARAKNDGLRWFSRHPDTKEKFEGVEIRNFQQIKTKVLELSKELFYLNYIGWDVVPLKNDFRILEGNYNSGVRLFQIHGGLLKEPRIKNFYEKNNVITKF